MVTFVPWEAFNQWKGTAVRKRGDDYLAFKQSIEDRVMDQMKQHYPELMKLCTYVELSTPLSTVHYCQTPQGAIYGLEATPRRYQEKALRPKTPLKNFYISGGDVASLGVVGAMMGGVMTAAAIDKKVLSKVI